MLDTRSVDYGNSVAHSPSRAEPNVSAVVGSEPQVRVECWSEWGRLRHVIVGVADGTHIPGSEPGFVAKVSAESDLCGVEGARSEDSVARANEQLDGFAHLLRQRGIRVDRPHPLDFSREVVTPDFRQATMVGCMAPRDLLITVGRELLEATMSWRSRWFEYLCYRPLIQRYFDVDTGMRHETAPKPRLTDASFRVEYLADDLGRGLRREWVEGFRYVTSEVEPLFEAADIVRCGRDLFVQHGFTTNLKGIDWLRRHFPHLRVHRMNFPGDPHPAHIDATFLPLRPGLALSNPERPPLADQAAIFRANDWEIVPAARPAHACSPPLCAHSTWLSMNVLSLDEKSVCVEASEVYQAEQLDRLGFEVVPVALREAYPFGGGLHCATTDIRRDGVCEDYFPVAPVAIE